MIVGSVMATETVRYVSSKYGTKCYIEGNENGNMKHKVYFDSREECDKFVK